MLNTMVGGWRVLKQSLRTQLTITLRWQLRSRDPLAGINQMSGSNNGDNFQIRRGRLERVWAPGQGVGGNSAVS